jgi:hypothetical protein
MIKKKKITIKFESFPDPSVEDLDKELAAIKEYIEDGHNSNVLIEIE